MDFKLRILNIDEAFDAEEDSWMAETQRYQDLGDGFSEKFDYRNECEGMSGF